MARIFLHIVYWTLPILRCHAEFYEPYERLPIDTFQSFGGKFSFSAGGTQSYDEGTPMTIRWTTDFSAVNLYVVYNASVSPPSPGLQRQLSTGYSDSTFDWKVSCSPDCEAPFAIKAVNAYGKAEALYSEGFWSRQFWIRPTSSSSSASPSSTSGNPSFIMSTTSPTSSTTTSSPSSSALATTGTLTTAPPEMPSAAHTQIPSAPTTNLEPEKSTNFTAIGAGVSAGIGVALLCSGAFVLWRRRKTKTEKRDNTSSANSYHGYGTHSSPGSALDYADHRFRPESGPPGYKDIYEAPGWNVEPQELPSRLD